MNRLWDFKKYGSSCALNSDNGIVVTYEDLERLLEKIPEAEDDRGLALLFANNTTGSVAAYALYMNSGYPVMVVSASLSEEARMRILKTYHPRYVLLPKQERESYPFMKAVMDIYDYIVLLTNYENDYPIYEELGLLYPLYGFYDDYTYVRISYSNLSLYERTYADAFKTDAASRTITALPMHNLYELMVIHTHLSMGASIAITERSVLEGEFWDFFKDSEITCFHGDGDVYALLNTLGFFMNEEYVLPAAFCSGGVTPDLETALTEYAQKKNIRLVFTYELGEAMALMQYEPLLSTGHPGSVGKPYHQSRIRLLDEAGGEICTADAIGEMEILGESVCLGYAESGKDLSEGDTFGGRFLSGEYAALDADGFLYLKGNKERIYKKDMHIVRLNEVDELILDVLQIRCRCAQEDGVIVFRVNSKEEQTALRNLILSSHRISNCKYRIDVGQV